MRLMVSYFTAFRGALYLVTVTVTNGSLENWHGIVSVATIPMPPNPLFACHSLHGIVFNDVAVDFIDEKIISKRVKGDRCNSRPFTPHSGPGMRILAPLSSYYLRAISQGVSSVLGMSFVGVITQSAHGCTCLFPVCF